MSVPMHSWAMPLRSLLANPPRSWCQQRPPGPPALRDASTTLIVSGRDLAGLRCAQLRHLGDERRPAMSDEGAESLQRLTGLVPPTGLGIGRVLPNSLKFME